MEIKVISVILAVLGLSLSEGKETHLKFIDKKVKFTAEYFLLSSEAN